MYDLTDLLVFAIINAIVNSVCLLICFYFFHRHTHPTSADVRRRISKIAKANGFKNRS